MHLESSRNKKSIAVNGKFAGKGMSPPHEPYLNYFFTLHYIYKCVNILLTMAFNLLVTSSQSIQSQIYIYIHPPAVELLLATANPV